MNKRILVSGSIIGLLAVILGAFAAHGLEKSISQDALETFQTGVRYQMYHAIVLLFVGSTTILRSKDSARVLSTSPTSASFTSKEMRVSMTYSMPCSLA